VFFDKQTFGADRLVTHAPGGWTGGGSVDEWRAFLDKSPITSEIQKDILRLETNPLTISPNLARTRKRSAFEDELQELSAQRRKVHAGAIPFYQTRTHGLFGVGIDAVPALDCWF